MQAKGNCHGSMTKTETQEFIYARNVNMSRKMKQWSLLSATISAAQGGKGKIHVSLSNVF